MRFVDTNILVYAVSAQTEDVLKRRRAREVLGEPHLAVSVQVLQEFYVTVVHKIPAPLSAAEALEWIEQFEAFPCQAIEPSLVKIGVELSQRYRISYWDGAIIAAADALGARTLFSEDLTHDQLCGQVRVVNPFLATVI